jgi:hypothetical protein
MKAISLALLVVLLLITIGPPILLEGGLAYAYPPGVGILSQAKNCLACHANNGPWGDEGRTIIDIIEINSLRSYLQPDGSFLLQVKRNESLTIRTVIGQKRSNQEPAPYRNAWIYVDLTTIGSNSLSKFAPGWDTNLQLSCRVVGDSIDGYENTDLTVLPMTIRPSDAARDARIALQVMLTGGESVKGRAKEGMIGNYSERTVMLKVLD